MGLSLIVLHEMDAIRFKEWRILPGLSRLGDRTGRNIFLFAHIPLFYWIFRQLTLNADSEYFRVGVDVFLILHLGLHSLFLRDRNNLFTDWVSWVIITAAGICGLLDLMIM